MKIKIKWKLLGIFIFFKILIIAITIYAIKLSKDYLMEAVKKNTVSISNSIKKEIDSGIDNNILNTIHFASLPQVKNEIKKMNDKYSKLNNLKEFISKKNNEWILTEKNEENEFMAKISANELSNFLKNNFINSYEETNGFSVFKEVFITNKYGVNIAQTNKTSDFIQSDEEWWESAKSNGDYISKIKYDESSENYVVDFASSIKDENGVFLGVIKASISVLDLIRTTDIDNDDEWNRETIVITKEGELIYSSNPYSFLKDISYEEYYKEMIKKDKKFYICKNINHLFVTNSRKSKYLDWAIVLKYDADNILKEMNRLIIQILLFSLALIILGFIISIKLSSRISNSISKLKEDANRIGEKNFEKLIIIKTGDEIEDLSISLSKMSEQIKMYYEQLELKNIELEIAKNIAEKTSKLKSEFLSNMSHELRTPLNGIMGVSKMLMKYDTENLTLDQKEGLYLINNSGKKLLDLINDILDLAKAESGNIDIKEEPLNVQEFLSEIHEEYKLIINGYEKKQGEINFNVDKKIDVPENIITDGKKLRQVIINLLSNSIKFTEQGEIILKIYTLNHRLYFEVSDTGIGIAEKNITDLFDRFTQVDGSSRRKYQGTGLGLNLCKIFVEAFGGEISIKSKLGIGTNIIFWIPMNIGSDIELIEKIEEISEHLKIKRVLVIEDDADSRYLYSEYLKHYNYECFLAEDGEIGLKKIYELKPDAIILDLKLPKITGFQILEKIKNNIEFMKIPTIIISVYDLNKKNIFYGLTDFLPKPISEEKLISTIYKFEKQLKESREKIIIVDDDILQLKIIEKTLLSYNYDVIITTDNKKAFELIEKENPNLVILDLMMPEINGIDILHLIRHSENKEIADIPVIINTVKDLSKEELDEIENYSANLIKKNPKSLEDVINLSTKLLNRMLKESIDEEKNRALILLAEDNEISVKTIKMMLREKYKIITAKNGKEAIEMAIKNNPDLILMDIMMPEIDGIEAYTEIRKIGIKQTPIIALTARAMNGEKEKILDFGFSDYISKPIDDEELIEKIEFLLKDVKRYE